jgi:hypothetical protein
MVMTDEVDFQLIVVGFDLVHICYYYSSNIKCNSFKSINLNNFALYLHSGISICTDVLKSFPDNFYWKLVFR